MRTLERLKTDAFFVCFFFQHLPKSFAKTLSTNEASALCHPGADLYSSGLVKNKQRRNYGES